MSFEKYGLSPEIMSGLADVRIEEPTSLHQEVLPPVLEGKHVIVKADSDDVSTFLIPALQKVAERGESSGTQVLILTPSIERAASIDEMIWAIGYHAQISSASMAMKGDKAAQEQALLDGAPVIVANPGRFIELLEKNKFRLQQLQMVVIDEAHNMENFSLVNRVKDILKCVDSEPQVLLFADKENKATKQLVQFALKNPEFIGFEGNGMESSQQSANQDAPTSVEEVDLEAAKEALEEASVEVVLPEDAAQEESPEPETPEDVDLEAAKEALEEASVDVVLPEDVGEESKDQENAEPESPEEVDVDAAKKALKKASVKVVLKSEKAAEQPAEESSDEDVPEPLAKELEQGYINVPPRMKISTLMAHLEESKAKKIVVFAASSRTTDRLFRIIRKKNWGVVSISDDIDENTYNERFERFTSNEMRVLLVGGLPANKVEIENVGEVINYDVPGELEEYRYRAELVGGGKAAQIISLVSKMDREDIEKISEEAGYPPVELPFPKELIDKKKKKTPSKKSGNSRGKKGRDNRSKPQRRGSGRPDSSNNSKSKSKSRKKPAKPKSLPRPTYDGLPGGRSGEKAEESKGVFGWVKKLFS